jgi:hypothetical protein
VSSYSGKGPSSALKIISRLIPKRKTNVGKYLLLYKCVVAKLGTAATGNFLSGKKERE